MKKIITVLLGITLFYSCSKNDSPTAQNNNSASSDVTIGSQTWSARNLDVDHYRNGDIIPQVTDATQWTNLTTGAWCYYNNDPANGPIYGKLYNWYAVNDPRGLAPSGYHIPTDNEWTILTNYLGGLNVAGSKMKETGTSHWSYPNSDATNSSGFNAIPGGFRDYSLGIFFSRTVFGYWWSSTSGASTSNFNTNKYYRQLHSDSGVVTRDAFYASSGYSVRCIKD
jgi:uncharacterized protein (TIGR02145 family)